MCITVHAVISRSTENAKHTAKNTAEPSTRQLGLKNYWSIKIPAFAPVQHEGP